MQFIGLLKTVRNFYLMISEWKIGHFFILFIIESVQVCGLVVESVLVDNRQSMLN